MTVSVILIAHNEAAVVARAISSVLAQTWVDFEFILIDDASSDGTRAAMQSFQDPRITVHHRPAASGAAAARNAGIQIARGEWIAFLDADDLWHPEKLAQQYKAAADPDKVDAVLCGFRLFRSTTAAPEIYLDNLPRPWPTGIVEGCRFSPGSALLIKKSCFAELGGFNENLRRLEDWDWWLSAASFITCRNVPLPLVDVFLEGTPPYATIAHACRALHAKHMAEIHRRFGPAAAAQFGVSLEFECTAAAYLNRRWLLFTWHLIRGGILHSRFWQKLAALCGLTKR